MFDINRETPNFNHTSVPSFSVCINEIIVSYKENKMAKDYENKYQKVEEEYFGDLATLPTKLTSFVVMKDIFEYPLY